MSSTFELIEFKPEHLVLLDLKEYSWVQNPAKRFQDQASAGQAYTALVHGRVCGVGGIAQVWHGVGEAWTVLHKMAKNNPFGLTREVKRKHASIMDALKLHRVQCFCKTSDTMAGRWAEVVGFTYEATLPQYGFDRSDYDIYSIVR
jgi:hypothetical protein